MLINASLEVIATGTVAASFMERLIDGGNRLGISIDSPTLTGAYVSDPQIKPFKKRWPWQKEPSAVYHISFLASSKRDEDHSRFLRRVLDNAKEDYKKVLGCNYELTSAEII